MVIGKFTDLSATKITSVDTEIGHMELLEYVLQDYSFIHVLQWHKVNELENNSLMPKHNVETFYKDRDKARQRAYEIGKDLLLVI